MSIPTSIVGGRGVQLYRAILREHRSKLPSSMKAMGNAYVRNEFNLHKTAKPEQLNQFFEAWTKYVEQLRTKSGGFGKSLSKKEEAVLSPEQKSKLEELKIEIAKDARAQLENESNATMGSVKNG